MKNCVFCQIVKGKLPCYQVYEDKEFLGFLDIFPRVKGHTLLIPKKHYRWVYDLPNFGEYWEKALKITEAMKKAFRPQFIYKTRKKALGPFKKELWALPSKVKQEIMKNLEKKFYLLFKKLNVFHTKDLVRPFLNS